MLDTVGISLRLLCTIKQEGRNKWVTGCPKLDLFSQGKTEEEAKSSLREAIALWVEDCLERGTLERALEECGFHKVHPTEILPGDEHITLHTVPEDTNREDFFPVDIQIPAYQAAALMAAQ